MNGKKIRTNTKEEAKESIEIIEEAIKRTEKASLL